jgi:hypothetical protein
MKKAFLSLTLGLAGLCAFAQETLTPIPSLNLPRYLGTWYEIAKYPTFFKESVPAMPALNTARILTPQSWYQTAAFKKTEKSLKQRDKPSKSATLHLQNWKYALPPLGYRFCHSYGATIG